MFTVAEYRVRFNNIIPRKYLHLRPYRHYKQKLIKYMFLKYLYGSTVVDMLLSRFCYFSFLFKSMEYFKIVVSVCTMQS